MIFGNIQNLKEYFFLEDGVLECFNYMKEHALNEYKKGVYEIDGKRLFVNIVEYETVDIYLMLEGTEQIDMNFIHNMDVKPYAAEDDFLPMEGGKNGSVVLKEGDFLICYPSDAHRTAVAAGVPRKIRKAIFKVRI